MRPSYRSRHLKTTYKNPTFSGSGSQHMMGWQGRDPQTMSEGVSWKLLPCAPGWDVDITCAQDHVDVPKRPVMSEQSFN